MPHAVPLATLCAGLGLLGGAVSGIHRLGGQLHGAAAGNQVQQRSVDYVRVTTDRPPGHPCPDPADAPPAPAASAYH